MRRFFAYCLFVIAAMTLGAQVPNGGFERWTNLQPDEWLTNSCPFCKPPFDTYVVKQDSDSYSGTYCANLYSNGVYKPYAYTVFPASARPVKVRFEAKVDFPPCINTPGFPADTVPEIG